MVNRSRLILGLALVGLTQSGQAQQLNSDQTLGRYITGYMAAVNITQDSLAKLSPWLGTTQTLRVSRLSAIRNGTIPTPDSDYVRLGKTIDSLFRARLDSATELRAYRLINQIRPGSVPVIHTVIHDTIPRIPLPPDTVRTTVPCGATAIVSAGMSGNGNTYQIRANYHCIPNGSQVVIKGHSSTPTFTGLAPWAKVVNQDFVTLWRDVAMTQPFTVTINGTGGTIQPVP